MKPILFQCSIFTVYSYGVFVAIAFLVSTWLLSREARQKRFDENFIYNLCIVLLVGGIFSARLFYVILNVDYFRQNLKEIIMLQHGGLVWFGGLLGAFICGVTFIIRKKKAHVLEILDLFVPYLALAQGIGRIGCFFNGCCYGKESAWGIYFSVHGRTLFPSQLLDSFTLLAIFVTLRLCCKQARAGIVFSCYIMLASIQRFLMEFIRGDERPFYFSLSIFQWMSVGFFLAGLIFYLYLSWKKKTVS